MVRGTLHERIQAHFVSAQGRVTLGAPATDLRWSRSGEQLLVAGGDLFVLEMTTDSDAFVSADNVAGSIRMRRTHHSRDIVSADFNEDGEVVTASRTGAIRRGTAHVASVPHARSVRCAPVGSAIAVVAEDHGDAWRSDVHVFLPRDDVWTSWTVADLPHLGGVAWSPDGREIAVRTHGAVIFAHADGSSLCRVATRDAVIEDNIASGRIAWTARGVLTGADDPTQGWLLVTREGSVERIPADLDLIVALASEGDLAVGATLGAKPSLAWIDLGAIDRASVTWSFRFNIQTTVALSRRAVAWSESDGSLFVVPWGEATVDPDRELLGAINSLGNHCDLSDEVLTSSIASIRASQARPSMQKDFAMIRNAFEDELKRRRHAALSGPLAIRALISSPRQAVSTEFEEGDIAMHAKFGEGVVIAVEGTGANSSITVQFASGPARTLRASFLRRPD